MSIPRAGSRSRSETRLRLLRCRSLSSLLLQAAAAGSPPLASASGVGSPRRKLRNYRCLPLLADIHWIARELHPSGASAEHLFSFFGRRSREARASRSTSMSSTSSSPTAPVTVGTSTPVPHGTERKAPEMKMPIPEYSPAAVSSVVLDSFACLSFPHNTVLACCPQVANVPYSLTEVDVNFMCHQMLFEALEECFSASRTAVIYAIARHRQRQIRVDVAANIDEKTPESPGSLCDVSKGFSRPHPLARLLMYLQRHLFRLATAPTRSRLRSCSFLLHRTYFWSFA